MKRIIYFDCIGGAGGDMILASLISLGVPLAHIEQGLNTLHLSGYSIRTWPEERSGIQGLRLAVDQDGHHHHRTLPDIVKLIAESELPEPVKHRSTAVFTRLAEAEGAVHGIAPEKVHFHEVGAVDSIVDIVGSVLALHELAPDEVRVSPLPMGSGMIKAAHGMLPLPAPATLELLKGVPVYGVPTRGELVTPTAAVLLTSFAASYGDFPEMKPEKIGYGAGSRVWDDRPNLLRAVLGRTGGDATAEVSVIETNVDDMNPELYGPLMDTLFGLGVLDVAFIPVYMKKNRPGTIVQVLCKPEDVDRVAETLFYETTTIGVRYHTIARRVLPRRIVPVRTPLGPVNVKEVTRPDGTVAHYPEFEDVRRLARESGKTIREVYRLVEAAACALESTGHHHTHE